MTEPEEPPARSKARKRSSTKTSSFGVSRRESHDSSTFYERFPAPRVSWDAEVNTCRVRDRLFCGDSRDMAEVADSSIALVVTSPPYFAAKEYERVLGESHVPGSYVEYLAMLRDVFSECKRVLEPGGRIAVNVANLGRKP
ncbi:MAG: DNA methyltransferase, partial [Acidimicrobiales bacterium]